MHFFFFFLKWGERASSKCTQHHLIDPKALVPSTPPHCLLHPQDGCLVHRFPQSMKWSVAGVDWAHGPRNKQCLDFALLGSGASTAYSSGNQPRIILPSLGQSSISITFAILEEILIWTCTSSHCSPSCRLCSLSTSGWVPEIHKERQMQEFKDLIGLKRLALLWYDPNSAAGCF